MSSLGRPFPATFLPLFSILTWSGVNGVGPSPPEDVILFWGLDCGAIFDCGGNGERFADCGDSLPPTSELLEREPEDDCLMSNPSDFHIFACGIKLVGPIFIGECLILDG